MLEQRLRSFLLRVQLGDTSTSTGMSDEDVRATCAFVSRCWEMDPARRATAGELLEDEWFRT